MIHNESVRGTQAVRPLDFEINGDSVYARANIVHVTEEGDEPFDGYEYEEVELTMSEFESLKMGNVGVVPFWTPAARCAERRARYERMDPKVRSLERRIALCEASGDTDGAESARTMLMKIHQYCEAVSNTQNQRGYPQTVDYPEEPTIE